MSAAAPDTAGSSTPSRRRARPSGTAGHLPRSEPRRHCYFGEEFGLTPQSRDWPGAQRATATATASAGSVPRLGGQEQTLGEKPFVDDMRVPGMLHGAMVLSEHPRARVLEIHTGRCAGHARRGARVHGRRRARIPRDRASTTRTSRCSSPRAKLTCCVADFLAMVVADTQFHARAGGRTKSRSTTRSSSRSPIRSTALEPGAPLVHSADTFAPRPSNVLQPTTAFSRGDVDAALAGAAHVIEATFQTQPVDIAFLEPEACLVHAAGGTASRFTPRARDRSTTTRRSPGPEPRPEGRRDRAVPPAAAPSARRRSSRSRRRRRWPRTCCSGR